MHVVRTQNAAWKSHLERICCAKRHLDSKMLIQFSVGNYRSFSDIQTFNMVAAPLSSFGNLDSMNVFSTRNDLKLLRSAAIYGANAAGKSNLFMALMMFKFLAISSFARLEPEDVIPAEPFLLSTETEEAPSFFEVVFITDGRRFRYGMESNQNAVTAEWLYEQKSSRETRLFTREGQEIFSNKSSFKEGENFKKNTRPNASFLSVCAALQGATSQRIVRWFRQLSVISGLRDTAYKKYTTECLLNGRDEQEIKELISKLDVNLEKLYIHFPDGPPKINKDLRARVTIVGEGKESSSDSNEGNTKSVSGTVLTPLPKWNAKGQVVGHAELELGKHASEGTQKLFAFAGPIVDTLKNGRVLFVDEFDARLHPSVSCALVKLFNSPETNPRNAQLVFATHDVNLLSHRTFRRDQIWFAEKNEHGATHLYSLAQFRLENGELPRKDSSFEDDYISGKFGAVPFLGNLSEIFDSPDNSGHGDKELVEVSNG